MSRPAIRNGQRHTSKNTRDSRIEKLSQWSSRPKELLGTTMLHDYKIDNWVLDNGGSAYAYASEGISNWKTASILPIYIFPVLNFIESESYRR